MQIQTILNYTILDADRIVSYRNTIFCVISYRIYRFSFWLYRAITTILARLSWLT